MLDLLECCIFFVHRVTCAVCSCRQRSGAEEIGLLSGVCGLCLSLTVVALYAVLFDVCVYRAGLVDCIWNVVALRSEFASWEVCIWSQVECKFGGQENGFVEATLGLCSRCVHCFWKCPVMVVLQGMERTLGGRPEDMKA